MKNMINNLILLTMFVSLSASSCNNKEELHRYIYLKNSTSKTIYYGLSYSYPDTSINKIEDVPGNNGSIAYKVTSGEQTTLPAASFAYNPTMQVFIFDANTIEYTPWDSIIAHHMVLKRYQFTESDIGKDNWTITYP
jgi:hypothetical protein